MDTTCLPLDLTSQEMDAVWEQTGRIARQYREDLPGLRAAPRLDPFGLRSSLAAIDLNTPQPWPDVLDWLDRHMREHQVHIGHPRYFGLFNPPSAPLGIAADALTAAYNPQLASWSHSPFANELERYLINQFGIRFGWHDGVIDGVFCSGGAEANHTALLCALTARFPDFANAGLRALPGQPTVYISKYAHHSWVKAARACGLGGDSVRSVDCDSFYRLDTAELARLLEADRRAGNYPVLLCGTAGTTGAGAIDPLSEMAAVAREPQCWYHVDAAWGGAARFVPEYSDWLSGIELADSITFDAHKFLSVPMAAGVFLTRHTQALTETFRIATDYMPRDAASFQVNDPYAHSLQWSRRFIGLKVFLPLAVAGWGGLAHTVRWQCEMGLRLRGLLQSAGWHCLNDTPLPVVCFVPGPGRLQVDVGQIARSVVESGVAWVSTVELGRPALRACITNFRSGERHLEDLVKILDGQAK